ncbi:MAG: hypothetical protein IJ197_02060 [Bacteroidaceae bacterium]|nr:hypothetical protein [Bacteroidaceae bacterium]
MQEENNLIEPKDADTLRSAKKDIIVGALCCLGGLAVTYLSYYFAKPGATFTVAYGAVIYGGYQGLRGLWAYLSEVKSDRRRFGKGLALGILGILAVIGLGIGGWKFSHKDDFRSLSVEQKLDDDAVGLHVTIPAGYTKIETFVQEETDSTYAFKSWDAVSDSCYLYVSVQAGIVPDSLLTAGPQVIEEWQMEAFDWESYFVDGTPFIELQMVELGDALWLKSAGPSNYTEETVAFFYQTVHRNSTINFEIYFPSEGEKLDIMEQRADSFISRVRLNE